MTAISTPENRSESDPQTNLFTLEQGAYLLLALVSTILRWGSLGSVPLSPAEATESLAIWQFWQTAVSESLIVPISPAYFSLTALVAPAFGFSDGMMRLVPALAGVGLIYTVYHLRHFVGRFGALVTAVMFTVSPTLVVASRTAGGDSLAMLTAVLVISFWWRYRRTPSASTVYWLVGLTAFGLTTSPIFYGFLVTFGLAWALEKSLGPSLAPPNHILFTISSEMKRQSAVVAGLVLFLSATFFATNLSGLSSLANLPVAWFGAFSFSSDVLVWLEPLFALARYEALVLILGLVATVWATWVGEPRANFFAYWYVITFAFLLIQAGYLGNVLLLTLPGYLLIGRLSHVLFVSADWSWRLDSFERPSFLWPLALLLIVLSIVASINLGRFARVSSYNPDDISNLMLAVICFVTGVFMWGVIVWWDRSSAWASGVLTLLVMSVILNWGMSWRLGVIFAQDTRERWIVEAADNELPLLVETISEVGRETKGSDDAAVIYSTVDHPLLRWYLRDFDDVTYGEAVPVGSSPDLAITADIVDPNFASDYIGTDFGFIRSNNDSLLTNSSILRWWFFAQSFQEIPEERIVLWLRADLVTAQ